jgi:hypothetical protein
VPDLITPSLEQVNKIKQNAIQVLKNQLGQDVFFDKNIEGANELIIFEYQGSYFVTANELTI